jgi:hypothetical protein
LASLGSLARHAESVRASFPASSPEAALRRGSESQKPAVNSAQMVDFLLVLVWDCELAGSHVMPAGLESPMALERSDSAEPLSAHLAFPPEHFRPATVSVQVKPLASVFRQVLSTNLQASRQISPSAKQRVLRKVLLRAGLVERAFFLQPMYLAKYPKQCSLSTNSRQVSSNWAALSARQPQAESRSRRAIRLHQAIR